MENNKAKGENTLLKGYNMLLYFAGSMIMYEPVEECIIDFWSEGILKALPVRSSNPRFMEAASQLRESCNNKSLCKSMLQDDFKLLLAGSEQPLAPPNKSYYIDVLSYDLPLKEEVGDFYNSYGWKKRPKYNVPDDNLGLELLFLTLLNDRYIALEDEVCRVEMRTEIKRFIGVHLLSWLSEWNKKMQEHAMTLCYKGIATLIYATCEDIYDLLDTSKSGLNLTTEFRN